jgi:hypothetical protein
MHGPLPGPEDQRRLSGDAGSGLVGVMAGVGVFLVFLLFAVQLLVGLTARSAVAAAAYDAASTAAGYPRAGVLAADGQTRGEARAREELGEEGARARFDWTGTDGDQVVLRIQVDAPHVLAPSFTGPLLSNQIDRTVIVRRERPR